jgi:hypothetical protein
MAEMMQDLVTSVVNDYLSQPQSTSLRRTSSMPYKRARSRSRSRKPLRRGSTRVRLPANELATPIPRNIGALERGEKYFKRTLNTTVGSPGYRIQMGTSAGGVSQFIVNGTSGADIQLIFQLAGIVVNVNGVSAGVTSLQGYTEFGSLFDEFAIDSIDLTLTPSTNMAQASTAAAQIPLIGTAIDYDDALDTNILALQQYETFKMIQPVANKPYHVTVRPRGQNVVLGIGTTYASLPNGTWMDCAYPATNLFGFKMALDTFPTGAASSYYGDLDLQCVYHLRFRDVR